MADNFIPTKRQLFEAVSLLVSNKNLILGLNDQTDVVNLSMYALESRNYDSARKVFGYNEYLNITTFIVLRLRSLMLNQAFRYDQLERRLQPIRIVKEVEYVAKDCYHVDEEKSVLMPLNLARGANILRGVGGISNISDEFTLLPTLHGIRDVDMHRSFNLNFTTKWFGGSFTRMSRTVVINARLCVLSQTFDAANAPAVEADPPLSSWGEGSFTYIRYEEIHHTNYDDDRRLRSQVAHDYNIWYVYTTPANIVIETPLIHGASYPLMYPSFLQIRRDAEPVAAGRAFYAFSLVFNMKCVSNPVAQLRNPFPYDSQCLLLTLNNDPHWIIPDHSPFADIVAMWNALVQDVFTSQIFQYLQVKEAYYHLLKLVAGCLKVIFSRLFTAMM